MTQQRRACDSCSRKKILCDGDEGACDWCRHHGLKCTYDRPLKKRMASAAGYASTSSFKRRIERLEIALNEAQSRLGTIHDGGSGGPGLAPNSGPGMQPRHHQQPLDHDDHGHGSRSGSAWSFQNSAQIFNLGRFHLAGHHIGAISSTSCLPVFSAVGQEWVYAATGQVPSFDKLRAYEAEWNNRSRDDAASSPPAAARRTAFPPRDLVEALFHTYCTSGVYPIFPVVDPVRFQQMIEYTYEPVGPTRCRLAREIARASVLAFAAMATLMNDSVDFPLVPGTENLDAEAFGLMASDYLPYLLQEPGVDQCSTLLSLTTFHVLSGHEYQGAMLLSLACRSLLVLNAQTVRPNIPMGTPGDGTSTEDHHCRKHLRQLFWLAHSMDKEMSLRTGHGPAFSDEFCDLTPPRIPGFPATAYPRQMCSQEHHHDGQPPESDARFIPPSLAMSLMKSRICRILYSEAALHKTGVETLYDIRLLDDELEQWRLSMPPDWRPSLVQTNSSASPASSPPRSTSLGYSSTPSPGPSSSMNSPGRSDGMNAQQRDDPQNNQINNNNNNREHSSNNNSNNNTHDTTSAAFIASLDPVASVTAQSPHAVISKLIYYHLLSVVHRASGRCRAVTENDNITNNTGNSPRKQAAPQGQRRDSHDYNDAELDAGAVAERQAAAGLGAGISSSLAISVQASRMTICCLRDWWQCTSTYAFWVLVFYPISAVLAIFCHILLDPVSPTVQEDLALIGCVPGIVRSLGERRRRPHPRDSVFYNMVDELCAELIRLGNCAVYRAVEKQMCELMS
ncbi:uncharacterized protein B0I36DRAFT_389324 [Microdochium trichocladiopsis]|uniref:Zn(2)-C6 fungal-type domain-containing protein n=1 Tax=Microdochium trichocladiopsis TaxID=1682393 RepID=A0A9P8XS63_9PEZI|nr:uncharacterized protein B0I36DRAFT_389324 [Microdochium trichocladiopsis]KAH7014422.1 hypothetical protein B0I36DRAFT_389324 [Microdochium trichocladiopsis]